MKKQTWRSAAGILVPALLATACSLEDFNLDDRISEGKDENVTIANKNSGTLKVNEPYANEACLFYVDDNPEGILSVEFLPTGTYVITKKPSEFPTAQAESPSTQTKTITVDTPKGPMRLPILTGKKTETRSEDDNNDRIAMGTYTCLGGIYNLIKADWTIKNGKLIMWSTGRTYTVRLANPVGTNALTTRLCHTWKLEEMLYKVYDKDNRLVGTYKLNEEEKEDAYVVFSSYGTYLSFGYDHELQEYYADAGKWNWRDLKEQRLHWKFDIDGDEDEADVYFSDNNLYMTREADDIDDIDSPYGEYGYKVIELARCSVVEKQ